MGDVDTPLLHPYRMLYSFGCIFLFFEKKAFEGFKKSIRSADNKTLKYKTVYLAGQHRNKLDVLPVLSKGL